MSVSITVVGIPQTQRFLTKKNKSIRVGIKSAMRKTEDVMVKEIKTSIKGQGPEPRSVDTGKFRDSVRAIVSPDTVSISSNVDYAKFLEFGTSKINARRHFANSANRKRGEIRNIINTAVKKATRF